MYGEEEGFGKETRKNGFERKRECIDVKCVIKHEHDKDIEHIGFRENNVYMIDLKQKSEK